MIDELQYAVQQEVLAILGVSGGGTILHTDFKESSWPTYIMPLVLLSFDPGDLNQQFLGGVTMEDWQVSFSVYAHRPDVSGLDPTGNSSANMLIIDTIRKYFSNFSVPVTTIDGKRTIQFPASKEMAALINKYGFRFTYGGKSEAEALEHPDGLCFGKKLIFNAIGLDDSTKGVNESSTIFDPAKLQQTGTLPAGSGVVPQNNPTDPYVQIPPYPSYGPVSRQ